LVLAEIVDGEHAAILAVNSSKLVYAVYPTNCERAWQDLVRARLAREQVSLLQGTIFTADKNVYVLALEEVLSLSSILVNKDVKT